MHGCFFGRIGVFKILQHMLFYTSQVFALFTETMLPNLYELRQWSGTTHTCESDMAVKMTVATRSAWFP
jgi:hypothetical protein